MKEKRIFKFLSLALFLASVLSCPAYSQDQENSLPNQLGTFIDGSPAIKERVFNKRQTQELISVELSPEAPQAGKKTQIIVRMKNDPSDVQVIFGKMSGEYCYRDDTFYLNDELFSGISADEYSSGISFDSEKCDASWNSFQLHRLSDNSWAGEFSGFEPHTRVFYSIRAVDGAKNAFVTIPCEGRFSDRGLLGDFVILRYAETDCVNSDKSCDNILPRGCMMKIADSNDVDIEALKQSITIENTDKKDNPGPDIADDLDIQDMRAGFDEENIYLDVAVKRNISAGSAYPLSALAYIAIVVNPEIDNPEDKGSLARAIGTFFYSRLFPSFILDDDMGPCHYGYNQGIDYIMNEENAACFVERNHIIFKIKRTAFGDEPLKQLKIMMSGSSLAGAYPFEWKVYDSTPFTTVMIDENAWFVVE